MVNCMSKAIVLLTVLANGIDSHSCKRHVCFTWSVSEEVLNLKCRVDNLSFRVKIKNPSNKIIGECYPGHQKSNCNKYSNNVFIIQNITTNETTCLIRGTIDNRMNGKWKCLHGTNKGLADVDVTVLRSKDKKCRAMLLSVIGYFGAITIWLTLMSICPIKLNVLEGLYKCMKMQCMGTRIKTACKGLTFMALTVLILIIFWIFSDTTDKNCKLQYTNFTIALVCGLIMAILFLNKEKVIQEPEQPPRNIQGDPVPGEVIQEPEQPPRNIQGDPVPGVADVIQEPEKPPMNIPEDLVLGEVIQEPDQPPMNIPRIPVLEENKVLHQPTTKGEYSSVPIDDMADGETSTCRNFEEESL